MNPRESKELAISKLLLIILAILGLMAVVWLAWIRPDASTPHSATDQAAPSAPPAATPSPESTSKPNGVVTQYLTITEWDIRAPLATETNDMVYTFVTGEVESTKFTFKRLQDAGICNPDVGVTMTRSISQNQPPHTIDNPAPIAKAGNYYYYLAYAGEPCTTVATDAQKQIANQINGGNLIAAVRSVLEKLEAL